MHLHAVGAVTGDSLVSAGTAILTAFVAAGVSLIVAFFQSRAHRREQETAAEQWRLAAEELRDRMAQQYQGQIDYLKAELRREQLRNTPGGRTGP